VNVIKFFASHTLSNAAIEVIFILPVDVTYESHFILVSM